MFGSAARFVVVLLEGDREGGFGDWSSEVVRRLEAEFTGGVTFVIEILLCLPAGGADMTLCFDIDEFLDNGASAGVLETRFNDPSGALLGLGFFNEFERDSCP